MLRLLGYWAGWWIGLWIVYGLFVGKLDSQEMVAGAFLAAVAALAAVVTQRTGDLQYRARWSWLGLLGRLPGRVLADCGVVLLTPWRALFRLRPVRGEFRTVPFDPGGRDPESAARRGLVVEGVSLAPNTYVVSVDAEKRELLVHQLVPSARPPGGGDREWPL